jgi:hypothetical protein
VICPKCSEVNSADFRFCGMCGTPLDVAPVSRRPTPAPSPQVATTPLPTRPPMAPQTQPVSRPVASEISTNPVSTNQVSMDSLRERAFSGLDSFSEAEQPGTSPRRILLLLMLLVALGVAGWWTYTNYLGATQTGKHDSETSSPRESAPGAPSGTPTARQMARDAAPESDAGSQPPVVPPAEVSEHPAPGNAPNSDKDSKPSAPPKVAAQTKTVVAKKIAAKKEKEAPAPNPAKIAAPPAADTGDAEFKKAEAFLYGRGGTENCDEATKYLKAASAKSNARARSTFGTMYATGHCVARDLPTSYLWFALALRVDPNNQILEKDLSAVWNQMTPPERQMATRMKQ